MTENDVQKAVIPIKKRADILAAVPWIAIVTGPKDKRPECRGKGFEVVETGYHSRCHNCVKYIYITQTGKIWNLCSFHLFDYTWWYGYSFNNTEGQEKLKEYRRMSKWCAKHLINKDGTAYTPMHEEVY